MLPAAGIGERLTGTGFAANRKPRRNLDTGGHARTRLRHKVDAFSLPACRPAQPRLRPACGKYGRRAGPHPYCAATTTILCAAGRPTLPLLPVFPLLAKSPHGWAAPCPPQHPCQFQVEGWRGEICHVAVTGPDGGFLAYKVIDPSHSTAGRGLPWLCAATRFPTSRSAAEFNSCGYDL